MTQSKPGKQQIVIASAEGQQAALRAILDLPLVDAWVVKIEPHKSRRSLPANALFHKWMGELSDYFTKRGYPIMPEEVKMLLKHKFLGSTEERQIGKTTIPPQVRSSADLNIEEMCEFMTQVEGWAIERGCYLTIPAMSQYTSYREASS